MSILQLAIGSIAVLQIALFYKIIQEGTLRPPIMRRMTYEQRGHKDFAIFIGITIFCLTFFYLEFTESQTLLSNTFMYAHIYIGALVGLLIMSAYVERKRHGGIITEEKLPFRFWNDLTVDALPWIIGAILMTMIITFAYFRIFVGASLVSVPRAPLILSVLGQKWSDALYQFCAVSPAEEMTKILLIEGLLLFKADSMLQSNNRLFLAGAISVGAWSVAHLIVAYQTLDVIIPLFLSGMVWFITMVKTKSVLAPIFVHLINNWMVIFTEEIRWALANLSLIIFAVLAIVLVVYLLRRKK